MSTSGAGSWGSGRPPHSAAPGSGPPVDARRPGGRIARRHPPASRAAPTQAKEPPHAIGTPSGQVHRRHRRHRSGGRAGRHRPGQGEPGGRGGPVQGRGRPSAARGGGGALRAHRPGLRGRGRAPGRRRLRDQLRRLQDERLGPRPPGQQRRPGLADGAPPERRRVRPLLDHRRVQAARPPCLRRGGRAGRQPRGLALPAYLQHLQDRRRGHGPVGGRAATTFPPPSPGCRCPTATGAGGRPSTSR